MKYYWPAIFEPAAEGGFCIVVPDIQGCVTQGDDMVECMWMVHDAIGTMLEDIDEKDYPAASKPADIDLSGYDPRAFVNIVEFDKDKYDRESNPINYHRERAYLSIKELSELIDAPYRTCQDWCNGKRTPPDWCQKLIIEKIKAAKPDGIY